jgi:hypothetical protein
VGGDVQRSLPSVYVSYISAVPLHVEAYINGQETPIKTVDLPAVSVAIKSFIKLQVWCKTIKIRVVEPVASSSDWKIFEISEKK